MVITWEIRSVARLEIMSFALLLLFAFSDQVSAEDQRPHIKIRGIYGGVPVELLEHGDAERLRRQRHLHGIRRPHRGADRVAEENRAPGYSPNSTRCMSPVI